MYPAKCLNANNVNGLANGRQVQLWDCYNSALRLPAALSGAEGQLGVYDFSTSIPTGNGPCTVDLVGVSSLVISASQLNHLHLTCG